MDELSSCAPAHRRVWSGLATDEADAQVGVMGVPFDNATSYRRGAAFAPASIRGLTPHVAPFTEEGEPLEGLRICDYGDVPADLDWERYFASVEARAARVLRHRFALFLGGDHAVTIPLASALSSSVEGKVGVVHFDAHLDLAGEFEGHRWSHACTERRVLELPNVASRHLACVGIRSWMGDEARFVAAHPEIGIYSARDIHSQGADAIAMGVVAQLQGVDAVYFTCDIDGLDPAYAPGTGVPEAGGPSTRELLEILRVLFARLPVRAMDIVEVSPPLDPSDITVAAAVKLIYEVFGWIKGRGA